MKERKFNVEYRVRGVNGNWAMVGFLYNMERAVKLFESKARTSGFNKEFRVVDSDTKEVILISC